MGIINSEFKPVGIRDVIALHLSKEGYELPNCPHVYFESMNHIIEISIWCDLQFGHENWYRSSWVWRFTTQEQLTLFKLTWM